MYKIIYSPKAIEDLQKLRRSEPAAYKKAEKFIQELKEHPKTGTGHPEQLKGDRNGQWSRTRHVRIIQRKNANVMRTPSFLQSSPLSIKYESPKVT